MLRQYFRINTAVGVGITIRKDGALAIAACQITANGSQLDFDKKIMGLTSVEYLGRHFPEKSLISLNINGKGVLHKQIEKVTEVTPNNFSKILPNANMQEFYVQHFVSGGLSYISVIRKSEADRLITQLREMGFTPVMLSLGPFPAAIILQQLNVYDSEVVFDGHEIRRNEEKEWTAYRYDDNLKSPFPLKIESEKIEEQLLIPYAAAFQLVMNQQLDPVKAEVDELKEVESKIISKKSLQVYGAIIVFITFLLLLINFLFFSWVCQENARMAYQVSRSTQNTNDVKDVQEGIKAKELELQVLGWDGGLSKAHLIDQMASCLPEEITWKQAEINPVDINESRTQKMLVFKDRQMHLTGFSPKVLPVNEWMARMKVQKWIKDIQLENYTFNPEVNTGQFTITITY